MTLNGIMANGRYFTALRNA